MENRLTSTILAGLAVGIALVALFLFYPQQNSYSFDPTKSSHRICPFLSEAMANSNLTIKHPTFLPTGYSLECAWADNSSFALLLWNHSITSPRELQDDLLAKGTISIEGNLFNAHRDPAYYIKNRTAEITSTVKDWQPQYHSSRLTKIEGHLAAVREQCDNCGIALARLSDGSLITRNFPTPTWIIYYDGDILYRIIGNFPSTTLERIGDSLVS